MINEKYYNDIKAFPSQFKKGLDQTKNLTVEGKFDKVMVCGMGGSSLYVEFINDVLHSEGEAFTLEAVRGYDIPVTADKNTLFIVASYSGNTEETLSCLEQIVEKDYAHVIFTSGGKLLEHAQENDVPYFEIPGGIQPRLSTGYFIAATMQVMHNAGITNDYSELLVNAANKLDNTLDEEIAKEIARNLENNVPIIYATDNNSSIARICKIKFNENTKTQAFWYFFPELNHNEMVGFTNLVMEPYFLIFQSQFTDKRNHKRIETFNKVMERQDLPVEVIEMQGDNVFEEMLHVYYLIDHVTYYLAEIYGVDPEPVDMVEEFKELLK